MYRDKNEERLRQYEYSKASFGYFPPNSNISLLSSYLGLVPVPSYSEQECGYCGTKSLPEERHCIACGAPL